MCVCVGIRSANKRDSCAKSFVTHHRILFSILSRAAALQLRLRRQRKEEWESVIEREEKEGVYLLSNHLESYLSVRLNLYSRRFADVLYKSVRKITVSAFVNSAFVPEYCVCVREKEIERQNKKGESSVCVGCCEILLSLLKAIALCVRCFLSFSRSAADIENIIAYQSG